MKKRDYEKALRDLDKDLEAIKKTRSNLVAAFRQDCKHPEKSLIHKANSYQDEYGSWTSLFDYSYECTRCGTRIHCKDQPFESVNDLREGLDNVNRVKG